jgi:integrase
VRPAWTRSASRSSPPGKPIGCYCRPGPVLRHRWTDRGRRWAATAARSELRDLAAAAWFRRRFAPHQLRHAHAVELAREGIAVNIIQRQLGHTDLGTTSTYLQGTDPIEIIDTVRTRRPPTIPMTAGLNL